MRAVYRFQPIALNLCWAVAGALALASCGTQPITLNAASPSSTDVAAPVSSSVPTTVQSQQAPTMADTSNKAAIERPAPADCYVDAVNAKNLDALVACFAPDAVIIDVSRRITGVDAIRTWANNEVIGGSLRVIESTPTPNGVRLLVHWAPRGSTGWQAYYTFDYQNGQLTQADLQYAN